MTVVASMTLPNFLVIGAAKCGTTALYEYLSQHPDVFMSPVKEPRFFALEGEPLHFGGPDAEVTNEVSINELDTYLSLFEGVRDEQAIGEASPLYLYHPRAPQRIKHYIPNVKMIAILRDPVERAFSGYVMNVMHGREKMSFEDAVQNEPQRISENWIWGRYMDVGRYTTQLERYYRHFHREQLRIYLYEDLKTDAAGLMRDVFTYLDVDNTFTGDFSVRHNASGIPRNKWLDAIIGIRPRRYQLSKLKPLVPGGLLRARDWLRNRNLTRTRLDPEIRAHLLPLFREDVLRLQDMIDRDLSNWLK